MSLDGEHFSGNGAFIGLTGNIPKAKADEPVIAHHMTMTGDTKSGIIEKVHDTFQVGSQSINMSGDHYNNMNGPGGSDFNVSPQSTQAFGKTSW